MNALSLASVRQARGSSNAMGHHPWDDIIVLVTVEGHHCR